jgi:cell division transport system permease protein
MLLVIGRTFKESLSNFARNGWLSIASVSVLVLSLFVMGILFVVTKAGDSRLTDIQERINVSVYVKSDVPEDRIMEIKGEVEGYSGVKDVKYISRDQALEDFKKSNANEPIVIQSLEEIGDNPLLASLVVKASNPNSYEALSEQVLNSDFKDDVSRVNYAKNKDYIGKVNKSVSDLRNFWLTLAGVFAVISVLIIFNTIRITIYTHKQEIEVMRLVGASNTYIRLPFFFEGVMYGFIATVVSSALLFAYVKIISLSNGHSGVLSSNAMESIFYGQDLVNIYLANFLLIFGAQLAFAILIGSLSSMIAMRKYLKI